MLTIPTAATHLSRGVRCALCAMAIAAASLLAGCPSSANPSSMRPGALSAGGKELGAAPVLGTEPVAGGVYLSLGTTTPLTGPALAKATWSRDQILQAVRAKVTADLAAATRAAPATSTGDSEAPPLAVKYYLQGRSRFLEGANTEAMDLLEKALQLDPEAFTVLRLMGRVCFAASQLPRGSMYLQRAQALRPADVETNYLLGRFWLERKDYERACYHLMQADDSPERVTTSAQAPLVSFYLARGFQGAGYHRAAAAEYTRFLELISVPVAGYRYDRELNYLMEEQWAAHLSAAENAVLTGDYAGALPHYRAAAAEQPRDPFVASRLINALMHVQQYDAARHAALELLAATKGADEALQLAAWVYRTEGRPSELLAELDARLPAASNDDPAPAMILAATQDYLGQKGDAFATLRKYLQQHPGNLAVLSRLAKRVDSTDTFQGALSAAAAALKADGSNDDQVLKVFMPVATSTAGKAFARQQDGGAHLTFAEHYLRALTAQEHDAAFPVVDGEYRAAVAQAPAFFPARRAYVSYLLTQEKFRAASELVAQTAADPQAVGADGPKALQLQIESEAAQQRFSSALALALEARRQFPNVPELRLQVAAIYRLREQDKQADDEVSRLIDDAPQYEPAYRSLINSLLVRSRAGEVPPEAALTTIAGALGKLNRALPDSRFGRLNSATFYARTGRYEDAEAMLHRLLADNPLDPEVLIPLAQVRQILGRPVEAVATLESALKQKAQPDLVRALASMLHEQNRAADALALTKQMMDENPDSDMLVLIHAAELVEEGKRPEAIGLLTAARKKFPRSQGVAVALSRYMDQADDREGAVLTIQDFMQATGETTERLYLLAHYYSTLGNEGAASAALQRVLAIMPDHVGANNDLGYSWVDAGLHLDQAELMIKRALENQPENPAFLDSMGWLYYKRGRFGDAIGLLQRSVSKPGGRAPEVLQHLGDALYRLGRSAEAVEQWSSALNMLNTQQGVLSRTDRKVKAYLTRITTAAGTNAAVLDVSPVVGRETPQSAGPATLPAGPPR